MFISKLSSALKVHFNNEIFKMLCIISSGYKRFFKELINSTQELNLHVVGFLSCHLYRHIGSRDVEDFSPIFFVFYIATV